MSVEVRSVNHRFFSPSIKLPGALQRWEGEVRDAMRRSVTRGHVTLSARFERDETDAGMLPIDEARFAAYVAQMRGDEGLRLAAFLDERLRIIENALDRIAVRAPERVHEQRERLRNAVRDLAGGVDVDEHRLAQEIALLADRLDVAEELSRFRGHITAFRAALGAPQPDGVGKRLGFLLQEMLREANTTGSKGNDSAIVADVLMVKEELERIREQVENLE